MKQLLIIIVTIIFCQTSFGQTYDKEYALSIKKNTEYLYAENQDSQRAFDMLMEKVRQYQNPEMRTDTTVDYVTDKAMNFCYQKNSHIQVTIFYVLKKDLLVSDVVETVTEVPLIENGSIVDCVVGYKNYSDLNLYLERRKSEKHDIQFKLIRGDDGTRNCYWIVFDNNRNVIAVLDTSLSTDLLTGQSVNYNDYVQFPKIWLQIF